MQRDPQPRECFVSVDVETSGPIPGAFSLLSIGACVVDVAGSPRLPTTVPSTFYRTLKPLAGAGSDPAALRIAGLSLGELARAGDEPEDTMRAFDQWIVAIVGDAPPVFIGLNAAFDWAFINHYFHRFLGRNPFGFAALDIKAFYMGMTGCPWRETTSRRMSAALGLPERQVAHHALADAQAQAELFARL